MKKSILFFTTLVLFGASAFAQKHQSDEAQVDDEQIVYRKYKKPMNKLIYPDKIFCFYPLAAIAGNFKLGMERRLTENTSIKTNVRIGFSDESSFYKYDRNNYNTSTGIYNYSNGSVRNLFDAMLELQYRYYFADKAPQGFYGGFYGYYKMATFNSTYSYTTSTATNTGTYPYYNYSTTTKTESPFISGGGAGILVGNQFISKSKIACDFYMGSGLFFTSPDGKYFKGMGGAADRYFNGIGFILGANIGLALGKN
ncbi:MAG: hypothetical protein RL708_2259 [Bacteroidota bacterium]|jgi:hypothetical protein